MSHSARNWVDNINLHPQGHGLTEELAGRAVRLHYQSGHVLEQHWQTADQVLWKGVEGALTGHQQTESYRMLKISEGIFLITWMEAGTVATNSSEDAEGPWLTDAVLDFNKMMATASWVGPLDAGGVEYVLDQARMEEISCQPVGE